MLKVRKISGSNPRKQFVLDFINQFSEICEDDNNYVLFALDANSVLQEDPQGMQKILKECCMVDRYCTIHKDTTQFPTQARGSKIIDYMLATKNIIPFITKMGYVTFNDAFDSDHRAIL
jgi:hypothetical protein